MDITNSLVELISWGFFGLALIIAAAVVFASISESRTWNRGVCRESGLPWRLFDINSHGERGYTDGAGNYCWISWPVDGRSQFFR